MEIKVCGMRELANLEALLSQVGPDWVGLIFYPKSPRFVSDSQADLIKKISANKVGVFVNEELGVVLQKIEKFGLEAVQLHGSESIEYVEDLKGKSEVKIWKVFPVGGEVDWESMAKYDGMVSRFLFDTASKKHGGTGLKFDWSLLNGYPFKTPFMLGGGLDSESEEDLIELASKSTRMIGVDLNSNFEIAPALKDLGKLRKFKSELHGLLAQKG